MKKIFLFEVVWILLLFLGCPSPMQRPPELVGLSPDAESFTVSEVIYFTARVMDPDGDEVVVTWVCSAGSFENSTGLTNTWQAPFQPSPVMITLYLDDGYQKMQVRKEISLEVTALSGPNLSLQAANGGSVTPTGGHIVPYTESLDIEALPDQGYHFSGWDVVAGSGVVIENPQAAVTSVQMNSGTAVVEGRFAINQYTLSLNTNSGIQGYPLDHGEILDISTGENTGYDFSGWTVDSGTGVWLEDAGVASTRLSLSGGDAEVSAQFTLEQYELMTQDFMTVTTAGINIDIHLPVNSPLQQTVSYNTEVSLSTGSAISVPIAATTQTFIFHRWQVISGNNVEFTNPNNRKTTVRLTGGDAVIHPSYILQ